MERRKLSSQTPREGVTKPSQNKGKGLGDLISDVTRLIGVKECDGCAKRKEKLNKIRLW